MGHSGIYVKGPIRKKMVEKSFFISISIEKTDPRFTTHNLYQSESSKFAVSGGNRRI